MSSTVPAQSAYETAPSAYTSYMEIDIGLGGQPAMTAVYVAEPFKLRPDIDVILYFHGFKEKPGLSIQQYLHSYFYSLRDQVVRAKKNAVFVARPWATMPRPGGYKAVPRLRRNTWSKS